jgi:Tol biopolymer transport system component
LLRVGEQRGVEGGREAAPGTNGDIAFVGNNGDQGFDIYVMGPDGTNLRVLRLPGIHNEDPAFSPDGTRLAFDIHDFFGSHEPGDIHVANADGSGLVNLSKTREFHEAFPAWYPSGRKLVYCGGPAPNEDWPGPNDYELYVLSFDEGGNAIGTPKRLTNNTAFDCHAAVSPGGSKMVFAREPQGQDREIYVMRTGKPGGPKNRPVKLTDNSVGDYAPNWSPNGRKIVYQREGGVWVMQRDGSHKKHFGSGNNPVLSPDGKWIAFLSHSQYTAETGMPAIWKMRTDGTQRTKLTVEDGYGGDHWYQVFGLSWQPLP